MSIKPTAEGKVGFHNGGIVDCVLADVRSPEDHLRGFIVMWLNANYSSFVVAKDAYAYCPAKVFEYYRHECARLRRDLEFSEVDIENLQESVNCERHCSELLRAENRRLKALNKPDA